ncbi:hypothetical protein [Ornithinimicrobium pratense]|uniref:Uncharacterized protein n=1 Tax=Ornithinimicrobium pratense TaxID=2593973 RepID=A0A5J6V305_9MICO|nr:hypothetical protein [Ornithinimicrobium pratense]QFG68078.1 hypothetical protein FY030_04500 [Ornithinimicrobium pratense]
MYAFHSITVVGAIFMIIFGAGLYRRLRSKLPADSMLPPVAFAGLLGTAVASILGSGLDTEFMRALASGGEGVTATSVSMYNHWIGTIPWLWTLAGLTGLSLYLAAQPHAAVPRWRAGSV